MNSYIEYVVDQLSSFGTVTVKGLFGGHGIYKAKTIVGIIVDNQFYLKSNKEHERDFTSLNSEPFVYHNKKSGKTIQMPYWKVPEEILENREKLAALTHTAYSISLSSQKSKK